MWVLFLQDLFLATKLSNENDGGANTRKTVQQQLASLRTDYIDLYMLHSPFRNFEVQKQTWATLEDLVAEGKIKSLGVSNFGG
jgi:diketogulonate reductase-like aldo/keto reductase